MQRLAQTSPRAARQRGMTLIMALIMLVVLTMLALTSFNLGKSNLQIVSNMQHRDEAVAAAHEVIEEVISSNKFVDSPEAALSKPCGAPNATCVDTNGDGQNDVKVTLVPTPTCVKVIPIKKDELNFDGVTEEEKRQAEEDKLCSVNDSQSFGVAGAANGNSLCSNSVWEIHAVATEMESKASVEVVQGVAVRVLADDTATACPAK